MTMNDHEALKKGFDEFSAIFDNGAHFSSELRRNGCRRDRPRKPKIFGTERTF